MHYRRMDPQPVWDACDVTRCGRGFAGRYRYMGRDGSEEIGVDEWEAPQDMPTAEPWQDNGGEWYWREASQIPLSRAQV